MRKAAFFFIALFFHGVIHSQVPLPFKDEFKVSIENSPSTVIQSDAKIFIKPDDQAIIIWKDLRHGSDAFYARVVDANLNTAGASFRVEGNESAAMNGDTLLSLGREYISYSGFTSDILTHYAQVSAGATKIGPRNMFSSYQVPWCGTGVMPNTYRVLFHSGKFFGFGSLDKRVFRKIYSTAGTEIDYEEIGIYSQAKIEPVMLSDGKYALFYVDEPPVFMSAPIHLRGIFFSPDGQITADSLPLYFLDAGNNSGLMSNRYLLSVTSVQDSLYQAFIACPDSGKVKVLRFNHRGEFKGAIAEFPLRFRSISPLSYKNVVDNFITNRHSGKFDYIINTLVYAGGGYNYLAEAHSFSGDGAYLGRTIADSTNIPGSLGNTLIKRGESSYIRAYSSGGDVYAAILNGFTPAASVKLNDEASGSNEGNVSVVPAPGGGSFVIYKDESVLSGRMISSTGEFLSGEKNVVSSNMVFINNGGAVAAPGSYPPYTAVLYFYDSALSPARADTLFYNGAPLTQSSRMGLCAGYNGSVLVLFNTNTDAVVREISPEGATLNEKIIGGSSSILSLIRIEGERYAVLFEDMYSILDKNLNTVVPLKNGAFTVHLSGDKFFSLQAVSNTVYGQNYYGHILNFAGDSLVKNISLVSQVSWASAHYLSPGYFLVCYYKSEKIYARGYSQTGSTVSPWFTVAEQANWPYGINSNMDNFFVGYSALRENYDALAKGYKVVTVTGLNENAPAVPSGFGLKQNYPNPFGSAIHPDNPTTIIQYGIPQSCRVQLSVYNVLGKEVATLVNEEKPAGSYEVSFNAEGLAGGIYFYRLQAGNYSETKKLVLLK